MPVRARLADEAGFTIVELLTAMVVGLAVLGAAFALVGRASSLQARTQDRVDAHQRGRAALEAMVTELRSGTCALTADGTSYPPIISGDGTSVAFYASTAGPNALPQRRELTYDASAHRIWEDVYQLQSPSTDTSGRRGQVVLSPLPARQSHRLVLDNVYQRDTGTPIFTYWSYGLKQLTPPPDDTYEATNQLAQVPVPITTAEDAQRVVQVRMAIRVRPAGMTSTANNPLDAILVGAAFARSADPVAAAKDDSLIKLPDLDPDGQPIYVGRAVSCS